MRGAERREEGFGGFERSFSGGGSRPLLGILSAVLFQRAGLTSALVYGPRANCPYHGIRSLWCSLRYICSARPNTVTECLRIGSFRFLSQKRPGNGKSGS